jgi:hypothetical protein
MNGQLIHYLRLAMTLGYSLPRDLSEVLAKSLRCDFPTNKTAAEVASCLQDVLWQLQNEMHGGR